MSHTLYACAHAAEFPAQALLRLRKDLRSAPVVVMDGLPTHETVCSLNRNARLRGIVRGMTRLEVEAVNGLCLLPRSAEGENSARAVFLECAAQFSPRIEEVSCGATCAFVLDIGGTERLFGPPEKLAEQLRVQLAEVGFRASIVVSANFDVACIKAASSRGITVIPEREEARALQKLPIRALRLEPEHEETFALCGIRTLGELAALPKVDLVVRLGARANFWHDLARGATKHTFEPLEPEFSLKEFVEFEDSIENIESLLFLGSHMIDCLIARATSRALSVATLTVQMKLEGGQFHERTIRPALPSADRKFLLKLLQLEIGAHPPQAAVVALTLTAEAGQSSAVQLGLFAPQTPEPSRLDVTLARLRSIVGEGRVGSPVLEDTHRSHSFRMENFAVGNKAPARTVTYPCMALRQIRPPLPVRVRLYAMRPAAFTSAENSYRVSAAYGPWRTSGCWWTADGWDVEEWDVLATENNGASVACLLTRDRTRNLWQLEAFYD